MTQAYTTRTSNRLTAARKAVYGVLVAVLFLTGFEAGLRLVGFGYGFRTPKIVADGVAQEPMFRASEQSEWTPDPGKGSFNSQGFVGPELPMARQPGVLRIAAVGDSCTQWGSPPYPERLQAILREQLQRPVEVLNAGVTGYSTYQGLQRLNEDVLPYRPDFVILYFGWNDHWLWRSHPDAGKPEPSLVDAVARRSRVVQVGLMLRDLVAPPGPSSNDRRPKSLRVPPEEFRRLLKQMIADVRAASAVPVVVTAPTDMTQDTPLADFPILEGLEQIDGGRFTTPKQLHDAYVQITREIAADAQATLVDAYQDFSGEEGLITTDHIHLTAAGVEKMAQLLAETLGAMTRE